MEKIGFVYLATNDAMPDLVKIGYTMGGVEERMRALSDHTGVPGQFTCMYSWKTQNPQKFERLLHREYHFCRKGNSEFFRIDWRAVKVTMQKMEQADGPLISAEPKAEVQRRDQPEPPAHYSPMGKCNYCGGEIRNGKVYIDGVKLSRLQELAAAEKRRKKAEYMRSWRKKRGGGGGVNRGGRA